MSSIAVDFDGTPRGFNGTTKVRLYDKSIATGTTITSWIWIIWDVSGNVTTNYPTTNDRLFFTNASTYWTTGDQIRLTTSGTLPTGILANTTYYLVNVTTTYFQISLTKGGTALTWTSAGSGTHTVYHASNKKNPIVTIRSGVNQAIDIQLTVFGSDGSSGQISKSGFLTRTATPPSKPTPSGRHAEISIFIYDSSNAVLLNRDKSTNNPLFFGDLEITNQMNLAGLATFKVYNVGTELATVTDKSMLVSNKNVVILIGNSIVFSGRIWKCTQSYGSLNTDSTQFQVWEVECESDIVKMKNQTVKVANRAEYLAPVGYIVSKLVAANTSSDIEWNGNTNDRGLISYEGPDYKYTVKDDDMYSQFSTLASVSGFDWRTRNNYFKYAYTGWSGSVISIASTVSPYGANAFRYKWVLFLPTTGDIVSYGYCTSSTTTQITLGSVKNPTLPATTGKIIIIGDPVLDFSSDLRQNTPVATFTANAEPSDSLQNCYGVNDKSDFNLIATKVVAKSKSSTEYVPGTKTPKPISIPLAAKDKYSDEDLQFENSAYITKKTEGYIIRHGTQAGQIWLEGLGYALKSGDLLHVVFEYENVWTTYSRVIGSVVEYPTGYYNPGTPSEYYPPNGTVCTTVTFGQGMGGAVISERGRSYVVNSKMYVNDTSRVLRAGTYTNVYVGDESTPRIITNASCGTDPTYGQYLYINAAIATYPYPNTGIDFTPASTHPHYLGVSLSNDLYSEASPQTGSPLQMFGLITKSFTPDTNIDQRDLEVYVINSLLYNSYYYRKGVVQAVVYDWYKPDVRTGSQYSGDAGWIMECDQIAILQVSTDTVDDVQYNQYKNRWQVISWTIDCNRMIISANLGDFERNMFLLMNDKIASLEDTLTT